MKTSPNCVSEKDRIQSELREEYSGLSLDEQKKKMEQEILANPVLADFYLFARDREVSNEAKVAEDASGYRVKDAGRI